MPIIISQQPIVMNISSTPGKLSQNGNGAKTLNLNIQKPELEMEIKHPKVKIDQSEPFAEAGLKNIKAFMEDNISFGRQIIAGGVSRIVSQGNELKEIQNDYDPIPDQAISNAYDMFDKEFNYGAIPTSRPTITLDEGKVNYSFRRGSVSNQSQQQKVQMSYTPYQVNYSISQYNSINFRYEKPNYDFMV
ncbi:DUF6470 family protein [Fusibacter bizertensis]|jgi:hypothetical protein|uniref:DUF6470 family protein n=1 Tax=Fusibacter bizertensis TaxID=1488331 RepID=A0ABT6NDX1_9FIRM|nr:DUF6470 family protein [Fusibacter bizertensis]MDH8678581.1 DUF6470 family protein [Fusibacter bizertensis]